MVWWIKPVVEEVKENEVDVRQGKSYRAKEVVDVALALFLLYEQKKDITNEEIYEHIMPKWDRYDELVYFHFLTDEMKDMFKEVRERKLAGLDFKVDFYRTSHIISRLRRMISTVKGRNIE